MAPKSAQVVKAEEMQTAILEMKEIREAEKMVAAIEKWKVGIPKMKAGKKRPFLDLKEAEDPFVLMG